MRRTEGLPFRRRDPGEGHHALEVTLDLEYHAVERPADPYRALDDGVEDRLHVRLREPLITRRISAVAVCRSSDSVSSRVARLQLLEQPHVLDGDDGLVGEGLQERDLPVREGCGRFAGNRDEAERRCPLARIGTMRRVR